MGKLKFWMLTLLVKAWQCTKIVKLNFYTFYTFSNWFYLSILPHSNLQFRTTYRVPHFPTLLDSPNEVKKVNVITIHHFLIALNLLVDTFWDTQYNPKHQRSHDIVSSLIALRVSRRKLRGWYATFAPFRCLGQSLYSHYRSCYL